MNPSRAVLVTARAHNCEEILQPPLGLGEMQIAWNYSG